MSKKWTYVGRATKREKLLMEEEVREENEFQQIEPGGWDEESWGCPIHYRVEKHGDWQMQAYTPSGNMMNGFHESFVRCGNCGAILSYDGGTDLDPYCWKCETELTEYRR